MISIVKQDHPTLRLKAKPVLLKEIKSPKIKKIIKNMSELLEKEDDGVAIAAPQIGEPLRIFVVSGRFFTEGGAVRKEVLKKSPRDLIFINPEIEKESKEKQMVEEGCLSVRWYYGKVKRAKKVKLSALNEKGERISIGASGLLSQVFQHETDHLNGILFNDKAENLVEMPPSKSE